MGSSQATNAADAPRPTRADPEPPEDASWVLLEDLGVGVMSASLDWRITRCSRRAAEMLGYAAEELLGVTIFSFTHPDDVTRSAALLQGALAPGAGRYAVDKRYVRKDGSVVWCHLVVSLRRDARGEPEGFIGTLEDITPRREAEERLRESEERLREAQRIAHVGSFVFELRGDEQRWSEEQHRIWELPPGTPLTLETIRGRIHRDDVPMVTAAFDAAEAQGTPIDLRERLVMPDGRIKHVRLRAEAVFEGGRARRFVGTAEDVTAQVEAERALAASERQFRELAENVPEVFWSREPGSGRALYVSPAFARIWGVPPAPIEAVAVAWREGVVEGERPALDDLLLAAERGQSGSAEYRVRRPDGEVRHVRDQASPVLDASGRVVRLVGLAADVTEEKRAEAELRRSRERLQRLVSVSLDVITVTDASGRFTFVGGDTLRTYGYTAEELAKIPVGELAHPDDRPRQTEYREGLLAAPGATGAVEIRVRHKDGHYFWMEVVGVNMTDDPAVGGILASTRDISDRKRWEEELRRMNTELERRVAERTAELADLYDNAPCGYHSLAEDGTFLRVNETELEWLGYTRDELVGSVRFADLLTPSSREVLARLAAEPGGALADVDVSLVRKDGALLTGTLITTTVRDAAGAFVETRGTLVDATRRHRAEEGLRRSRDALSVANASLERASRAKDEFLASMSHELRTPLNGVLGLTEALEEGVYGPIGERQRRALRRIGESGRHLLALIGDILDLSKIEADRMPLELAELEVDDVCRASLRLVQDAAAKKRQRLSLALIGGAGTIQADDRRLKQILVNLLSNAVKFTPEGGSVTLEADVDGAPGVVRFTVADDGIGIAEDDQAKLFQPFVQLDAGLSRRHAGTGLGLSLVRKLVELHGGSVSVESAPGRGARFTVRLPARRRLVEPEPLLASPAPEPRAVPASRGGARRVLLADDDELNLATFSDFLRAHGFEVEVARDGREALELARESPPDVVVMDIQMPVLDGLAAIRELRASSDPALREVPVVALTALAMAGDRRRCLDAGATEYLAKPVGLKQLAAVLDAHAGPRP